MKFQWRHKKTFNSIWDGNNLMLFKATSDIACSQRSAFKVCFTSHKLPLMLKLSIPTLKAIGWGSDKFPWNKQVKSVLKQLLSTFWCILENFDIPPHSFSFDLYLYYNIINNKEITINNLNIALCSYNFVYKLILLSESSKYFKIFNICFNYLSLALII